MSYRSDPAIGAESVSPDDVTPLSNKSLAIYVGGAGNLEVITVGGNTVIFGSVAAGSIIPIRCTHVKAANTTATAIVALY